MDRITEWELNAAVEGWNAVHGIRDEGPEPMSEAEYTALVAEHV